MALLMTPKLRTIKRKYTKKVFMSFISTGFFVKAAYFLNSSSLGQVEL